MRRVKLVLEARAPIAVGEWMTSRSNVRESLNYIPGGVLRGALAQAVLEQIGQHRSSRRALGTNSPALQQAFELCFGKSGAQFGFLMPFENAAWIPAPATALFNKQDGRYLYDTLVALLRDETYSMECPHTGYRLERGRGFLVRGENGWSKAPMPPKRLFVRVGLNRQLEAAQEGILYAIEAIEPFVLNGEAGRPLRFTGEVRFPDAQGAKAFETILNALRWHDDEVHLRLGSARSRGFGEVSLTYHDAPDPEPVNLKDFAERAGKPVFTLLARTPVIVYDPSGTPAPTLTPELLNEYLPGLPASVRLLPEATRIERELVSGWSGAWGMPKPVQQAFAPGNVFTYTYDPSEEAAVAAWLQQLTVHALGERTAEGYGQIVPCSPYHLDTDITQFQHSGGAQ